MRRFAPQVSPLHLKSYRSTGYTNEHLAREKKWADTDNGMHAQIETSLNQMKQGLGLRPHQIDLGDVVPIFVPASFFAIGNWPGPYSRLRAQEIGLTWTVLLPHETMRYVDFGMQEHWEANRLDWKGLALNNLEKRTDYRQGVRQLDRAEGGIASLAFMFEDGLGPSRLLCRETLRKYFPEGYRVAIPEMSFGFAFASDLQGKDLDKVTGVIDGCFKNGTRPLAPGIYEADDLLPLEE
jgi:hypothetical protein